MYICGNLHQKGRAGFPGWDSSCTKKSAKGISRWPRHVIYQKHSDRTENCHISPLFLQTHPDAPYRVTPISNSLISTHGLCQQRQMWQGARLPFEIHVSQRNIPIQQYYQIPAQIFLLVQPQPLVTKYLEKEICTKMYVDIRHQGAWWNCTNYFGYLEMEQT